MSAVPTFQHPSAFGPYLRHGWKLVPIQAGTKGPQTPKWNDEANCITSSSEVPPGYGAGLAHAYSGTCAIDLDDVLGASLLFAERGIDLQELLDDSAAVQINSGRPGSGKLIYRLSSPLPSKKINIGGKTILELRCATANGSTVQDLLPPSLHPSGTTYQWAGQGNWQNLPELPVELLNWWKDLVEEDQVRHIAIPGEMNANWDEIRTALFHISPDVSHDEWVRVGMALQCSDDEAQGFQLWSEWSETGTKYPGPRELAIKWRSFKNSHPAGVTVASLFYIAREHGWHRPAPDVRQLFASVEPVSPSSILSGMLVRPPAINFDLLPPILAKRALEIGDSIGCDPLVPVLAGLGAVCAAADARSRLTLCEGFRVPPVLWLATIGSPSAKKTPGATPMLSILNQIERDDAQRYAADMQKWTFFEGQVGAAQKAYLKQAEEGLREFGDLSDTVKVPELPPRPVQKRLTVMDATSQKLLRMSAERPEGMLVVLDEMATWLAKMASPMSGEDRSSIVQAYSAMPYSMERVGAGSIPIENLALSVYGNIQPKIFRQYLKHLATDGFIQRFIPVALDDELSKVGQPQPLWATSAGEYDQMVRRVHAAPAMEYYLDQVGSAMFQDFMHWADDFRTKCRISDEADIFLTALGKIEGTAGRLILVCHLAEAPGVAAVSPALVMRVLELVKSFIVPSLRHVYGDIGGLADDNLDRWMMDHVISIADQGTVTLSDIKRSARRQIEDRHPMEAAEALRSSANYLESLGWLVLTEDKGRSTVWAINPDIGATFAEYRATVRAAKQAIKDDIKAWAAANGRTKKK